MAGDDRADVVGVEEHVEEVVVLHARQAEQGVDPDLAQRIDDEVRDGVLGAVGHAVHRRVAPCGSCDSSAVGLVMAACSRRRPTMTRRRRPLTAPAARRPTRTVTPQQFATLSLPSTPGPHPVVVLIHGGFWRAAYGLDLMEPLAADLVGRGYAAWNIEYRRVGQPGGGWPGTLEDVAAAIDQLAELADCRRPRPDAGERRRAFGRRPPRALGGRPRRRSTAVRRAPTRSSTSRPRSVSLR